MTQVYVNKLYNRKLEYYNGYESFCYQNCLRIILENKFGTKANLFINTALSVIIKENNGFKLNEVGELRSLLPSINDSVHRLYYDEDYDENVVFEENIKYMYEHDEPIVVGVDTYYLPYASNYLKNHAKHTLILCGYDLIKREVYVIDWYSPWFFKGTLCIDDFLLARKSKNEDDGTIYSGSPVENNWAYIMPIEEKTSRELLVETLNITKANYYNNEGIIVALDKLKVYLNNIEDNEEFKKIYYFMYSLYFRKKFFLQYLELYAKDDNIVSESLFVDTLKSSIANWDVMLILILKQSRKSSEKTLNRIIEKIGIIMDEEKIMMKEIDNVF